MKRHLSTLFIIISILILIIGLQMDVYWSGIASWGLSFISLFLAVYFTRYIPNDKDS